jgi:porin
MSRFFSSRVARRAASSRTFSTRNAGCSSLALAALWHIPAAFAAPAAPQATTAATSNTAVTVVHATATAPDAEQLGPDPAAIKRPANSPIPLSGVPTLPTTGVSPFGMLPIVPSEIKHSFHQIELDAITKGEGPSALLPASLDAQRNKDLDDPYYVPTAGTGHLVEPLMPFRNRLKDKGFSFSLSYKGEWMGLFAGGLPNEHGNSYVHELTLQGVFDLGKMAPSLNGWSVHTLVMERAGKAYQGRVGEQFIALQEVYTLSGNVAAHLVDMYAEKKFRNNTMDLIFGRMSLTHVYATSPLLCSFQVTCSAPVALKQNPGFSVYPKATWGARLRFRPTRDTAVQVGAYSVSALSDNPSGWAWGAENATGLSLPIEFTWAPFLTRNRLPGHYVIGYAHDTTRYADKIGTALPAAVTSNMPGVHSGPSDMFWLETDQMVYRLGGRNQMAGGYLMAGYVHVTPRAVNVSDQVYGGFSLVGLIPTRTTDRFGVLYSWYKVSDRRRESQMIAQDMGLPLGVRGVQNDSHVIEAYYGIDVLPGLLIQPEFQYMIHPGETHNIPNSAAMGLKVIANL